MGFIIVPSDQKRVPVKLLDYPAESDPDPYPVPDNAPIENWPLTWNEDTKALPKPGQSLEQLQREGTGDRHVIVVDPDQRQALRVLAGAQDGPGMGSVEQRDVRPEDRHAAAGALDVGRRRRAADLPGGRALRRVRARHGRARHALHGAEDAPRLRLPGDPLGQPRADPTLPRMGERFRLRKDFDISGFPPHVQAILKGLKKYGMFVADNGGDWRMSIAPDRRLKGLETLRKLKGSDFEVVDTGARSVEGQ